MKQLTIASAIFLLYSCVSDNDSTLSTSEDSSHLSEMPSEISEQSYSSSATNVIEPSESSEMPLSSTNVIENISNNSSAAFLDEHSSSSFNPRESYPQMEFIDNNNTYLLADTNWHYFDDRVTYFWAEVANDSNLSLYFPDFASTDSLEGFCDFKLIFLNMPDALTYSTINYSQVENIWILSHIYPNENSTCYFPQSVSSEVKLICDPAFTEIEEFALVYFEYFDSEWICE